MKKLILSLVMLMSFGSVWADSARPKGFPSNGLEARIVTIDSTEYKIEADGLMHKVTRAVKIITPELKRKFLFEIKPDSAAVIIKDNKGVVIEIWLLPADYPLMES